MVCKSSIRRNFLVQLILSSALLILIFSSMLYFFIEKSIYNDKHNELVKYAKNISSYKSVFQQDESKVGNFFSLSVEIIYLKNKTDNTFSEYETTTKNRTYLTLLYPFNKKNSSYLKITKDITATKTLLQTIINYIFIINIAGFVLVIIYAITLSKILVTTINTITSKLSNMNEHLIKPLNIVELPQEFEELGITINHLISRIQNFVKYQKELFIGTAHELKTPLAVIKLKNQVTLIKERPSQEYIDALNVTNKTIDEMNIIVSNILNIGRQEGAQLDKPTEVDVVEILKQKANDFKLLAENEGKHLKMDFEIGGFMATLQVTLLNQIVQNFLQNAIKFTPKHKIVELKISQDDIGLLIEVIDEGCGIDEGVDLFAPFKRQGNKSGVGLGLFLAKSAADALGAKINLKNRNDEIDGTIASLQLNSRLSCIIPRNK